MKWPTDTTKDAVYSVFVISCQAFLSLFGAILVILYFPFEKWGNPILIMAGTIFSFIDIYFRQISKEEDGLIEGKGMDYEETLHFARISLLRRKHFTIRWILSLLVNILAIVSGLLLQSNIMLDIKGWLFFIFIFLFFFNLPTTVSLISAFFELREFKCELSLKIRTNMAYNHDGENYLEQLPSIESQTNSK